MAYGYQKVHHNVNINYQSIASGGVKQFVAKTIDFGASDTPLIAEGRQAAPWAVQIPETIGSVAVVYNRDSNQDVEIYWSST